MRRIFIDPENISANEVILKDEAFRHAIDVLRLKTGDRFQVLSGQPQLLTVELSDLTKKSAAAQIIEKQTIPALPAPTIHLAISMPRFNTFEWIVEKAVELGVSSIQPLISENSFIKKKSEITESKLERLNKIIRSATEQTIRPDLMAIRPVQTLQEWANRRSAEPCLFGYELAQKPARVVLESARQKNPEAIWALAGSEGGFSEPEVQSLLTLGYQPATLGSQILRAETACVALISIIKYEFDHFARS